MKRLPSIDQFLDTLDPDKTVDRKRAATEITAVVIFEAVKDISKQLTEDQKKSLGIILNNKKLELDNIVQFMTDNGKKEQFLNLLNDNAAKVCRSYIQNHLEKMDSQKKEEVYSKFPVLREL